ncbi:Plasmodium exported protein, unknown function [Plasmodium gallinaceum]|uniref:Plasmodium RESA N-terminal domain-containing protein n=1 Tax=Plasmodium gallinaceum TaxID=5849 RepID=A0A1J1GY38_PLAGA|nr:Plasmodium exported protein, unknown function [Plasmodium gallinaceum]CRG97176.1 Plasmodium exported protein, unknown function [Plasmodium gallinaceum]
MNYRNHLILRFSFIYFYIAFYFLLQCTLKIKSKETLNLQFNKNHVRNLSEHNVENTYKKQETLNNLTGEVLENNCYEATRLEDSEEKIDLDYMRSLWKDMYNEQTLKNDMLNSLIENWDNMCLIHGMDKNSTIEVCKNTRLGCWNRRDAIQKKVNDIKYYNEFKELEEGCTKEQFLHFLDKTKEEMEVRREKLLITWKECLDNSMKMWEMYVKKYSEKKDGEPTEDIKKDM